MPKIEVECIRCGRVVMRKPSDVLKRTYCSRACYGSLDTRFAEKVERDEVTGCLIWTGANDGKGYGIIRVDGRRVRAHRWSYERHVGPVPDGLLILHSCDTPACVEPTHLRPGTDAENMADRDLRGRNGWARRTHCKHNHEYTPENTAIRETRGYEVRICLTCQR